VSLDPASVRKRFVGRIGGANYPIDLEYTPDVHTNPFTTRLLTAIFFLSVAVGSAQNAGSAKSKQPIATVEGQTIYDDDLIPSVQTQLLRLRSQEYEIKKKALDNLIEQRLLEAAARKKGIASGKLLEQEIDAKVPEPTDAELQAYYLGQKDRLNRPLDEVKDQLRLGLRQARIEQARQNYLKALPRGGVVVLLTPPKVQVAYDAARVRGNPKAPVMIIEFADFQCPFCRRVEPTLKDLSAKYGEKVSLAYRDFPLSQIHSQAEQAAEASRCAGEQGEFWQYHDQLFGASNLQRAMLLDYAHTLKLDEKQFDSCLASEKYKTEIERDTHEGTQAGVTGTPGFFINGVALSGAQPLESFVRVIDEELARKQ
jgi:protein-disulfide isomerase